MTAATDLDERYVPVTGVVERGPLVDYRVTVPADIVGPIDVVEIPGVELDGPARCLAGAVFSVVGRRRDRLPVPLARLLARGTVIYFRRVSP